MCLLNTPEGRKWILLTYIMLGSHVTRNLRQSAVREQRASNAGSQLAVSILCSQRPWPIAQHHAHCTRVSLLQST